MTLITNMHIFEISFFAEGGHVGTGGWGRGVEWELMKMADLRQGGRGT